jgi:hypothetical protein
MMLALKISCGIRLATPSIKPDLFLMKRFVAVILFAAALSISSISAQAPVQKEDQIAFQLAKDVQAQQVEIAANQTKIEAKLAEIAEAIRIARIFSSRGR